MAGDWIKVEKATSGKPEILRLAAELNIHPDQALGICIRFWFWCDDQLSDGHARGVTKVILDAYLGHAGFCDALELVGWLKVRESSLEVPNFDRNLSESAKKRALAKVRKENERTGNAKSHAKVTKMSRSERDKSVTREEKRREENNSLSPLLGNLEFRKDWERWKRHRSEKFKPLGASEEDVQLMELGRLGWSPEEAGEVVRFSTARGALNLILNGDHKKLDGAESPEAEKEYDLI